MKKYFTLIIFSLSLLTSNLFAVDNELLDNLLKKNKDLVADGQVRIIKGKFTTKVCDMTKGCKLKDDLTGITYVLNTSLVEWANKELLKISKVSNEAILVGFQNWYEEDGNAVIDVNEKGEYVFNVLHTIGSKVKYSYEKAILGKYECGDFCYINYKDTKGKEKYGFASLQDDLIELAPQFEGQEVGVLSYMDKKDRIIIHFQPLQNELEVKEDEVSELVNKGTYLTTKCEDEICDMEFKSDKGQLIVSAYSDNLPKLTVGKNYTIAYEQTIETNPFDGGTQTITRMLKDIK